MPNAFNFSASPFDSLTQHEQRLVRDHVDVVYFRADEVVLDVGAVPAHLFVVIKGYVNQLDADELTTTYGPDDCFDGRGLVAGKASSRFVAAEEVVAYALARHTVQELIAANATFGALLFSDLGAKLSAAGQRQSGNELQALNMARVDQAFVRPAHVVDAGTDVVSVVRLFQQERTTNVLVQDGRQQPPRLGIFTTNALQRAILSGRPLDQIPVGELSNYSLISVRPGDQVGDALAIMLRHHIHRVVVADGERIHGVLEALDVFSFLSNHSMLITLRINDAADIDELAEAAAQLTGMIGRQFRSGTRVGLIARMVQDLNARLFDRAWQLIAPAELVANSCLFVMGSEGRGEQLLKTVLSEAEGRTRLMSDLARWSNSSLSRLSHVVTRLEKQGWVRREVCESDRRATNAVLTDEGFAHLRATAPGHVEEVRRLVFEGLEPEQVRAMDAVLKSVLERVDPGHSLVQPEPCEDPGRAG